MRLLPLVAPLLLGACYTYVPMQPASVQPGMSVRARVTPVEAGRLAPLLRVADARVITGVLIDNGSGSVLVEVPSIVPAGVGSSFETLHQRVSIPVGELVELEARTLDRQRTGALVGAAVVAVGIVVYKAVKGDAGRDRGPTGGGTDTRIPPPRR